VPSTREERIQGLADFNERTEGHDARTAHEMAMEELGDLGLEELLDRDHERVRRTLKGIREDSRCFCMTTDPRCSLMWSHYANGHTGVCVEFTVRDRNQLTGGFLPVPVRYEPTAPVLRPYAGILDEQIEAVFTTKALCWQYEKEWRTFPTRENRLLRLPPDLVSAVYAGWAMKPEDYDTLSEALAMRGGDVKLYRMKRTDSGFGVTPVEVVP